MDSLVLNATYIFLTILAAPFVDLSRCLSIHFFVYVWLTEQTTSRPLHLRTLLMYDFCSGDMKFCLLVFTARQDVHRKCW